MDERELLAERFDSHRGHLRGVAYRLLGSFAESDDAVQEAWLRLDRSDATGVENLRGWLTTVVARIALDMLRSRTARREDQLERLPDPVVTAVDGVDPEHSALQADSIGLALLVLLDALSPAERLALVLHDMFGVPFAEIAPIVGRSVDATKQLASRARRRVRAEAPEPEPDPDTHRRVVEAFLAASRSGDFEALVAVLDPDVVLRADTGAGRVTVIRGAAAVAGQALGYRRFGAANEPAVVNGALGLVRRTDGQVVGAMSIATSGGRIVAITILADAQRLRRLPAT